MRDLARMARRAKERGVARTSLTSNGTLPAERYLELVDAGLDELRISIDAADERTGDLLTARRGMWRKSIRTARALGRARKHGADFFLIFNLVVTRANRAGLPRIVRFLVDLGADDVKLITEVDRARDLADFPERDAVERALAALVAELPDERFPLLRRKLGTVFAPDSIGLDRARPHSDGTWRCYVPLTERTVDAVNYYPCSVYLREGGAPLGRIDEPQSVQRAKTAAFVARGDCTTDPICARYCLHCTREFNQHANEARAGARRAPTWTP
ncbi:MAG: radical SAM protein [Planctomycetes bacterium]|nr:radical SAM protein [Planctomycetota bacterium]